MLRSLGETQRQLGIFGGGGDQLRAGTMFLATLYFALPLLGKSRPPLDFLSAESFRRAALHPARKKKKKKKFAARVRRMWDRKVSLWGRGS